MAYKKIGGIYSALLTSFDKDGNINEKGIRELVRYNIDHNKVDGLYVGGSTGENFLLSPEEKEQIFKIVKDEAKDGCQLIAQVGSLNIKESVKLAKLVTDLGYDSLSAVTPFYYKFSFNEIKEYYNTILKDVDNQMVVYFIPFLTGVNISVDQFKELFANEKITGVKFTAGDFYLLERFRKAFPDKVLFAGFDEMMLPATVLGVDGAIGSTFNVNGLRAREIFEAAQKGDIKKALEVQHVTNDFISDVLANGLYGTLKICLQEAGVDAGYCRQPMGGYSDEMIVKAKEIFHKYF